MTFIYRVNNVSILLSVMYEYCSVVCLLLMTVFMQMDIDGGYSRGRLCGMVSQIWKFSSCPRMMHRLRRQLSDLPGKWCSCVYRWCRCHVGELHRVVDETDRWLRSVDTCCHCTSSGRITMRRKRLHRCSTKCQSRKFRHPGEFGRSCRLSRYTLSRLDDGGRVRYDLAVRVWTTRWHCVTVSLLLSQLSYSYNLVKSCLCVCLSGNPWGHLS